MEIEKVIKQLQRNGVNVRDGVVRISKSATVGNKTYGKIDFLVNYHRHTVIDDREGSRYV